MKNGLLLMLLFLSSAAGYALTLRTGTYSLSGGNSSWGTGYQGEVVIAPQGENYQIIWRIGNKQSQIGIGILQDDILSVAFTDVVNPKFWGVASYRINPFGELEGIWTGFDGKAQKPEYLVWKNHFTY